MRIVSHPPPGWGASVSRFFRTGCTVLWHSSKNLVEWAIAVPQPFSIAVHLRSDVDQVDGNNYRQLARTGNLSSKPGTCAAPRCPVREFIPTPRERSPNAACRIHVTNSLGRRESSYALVEHMHTLASGHSHHGALHHRRHSQGRF